uniref:FERM, ARHGEF and pleckstrin domain-containing protein 1 n=1 Tax=Oncorhynchus kisutch TaxID=8019 RepID=A0A8C7MQU7_ONCKI
MVEPEHRASAAQRLGAQETLGISTLDPGHRPPTMPPGRHVSIKIRMLDDTEEVFDVSQRASGKVVFDLVCTHLNLVEGDYFSLEYQDHHKMMVREEKNTAAPSCVVPQSSFKHDLACGRLACNDSSAALLVSHIIQSEIGDFEESQSRQHLLNNSYIPDQVALIDRIMEFHSKNVGQTPAESDYQLLEVARRLELYGVRLHPAKDREGSKLSLAVAHTGVLVFQGHTKINAFNWSKVRKLSFKRKRFLIKLRPDLNSSYQDTLEFLMGSRDCCKVFWKICVEYHAFFRLFEEPKPKPKPVLFTRGSSFRFSGRTQKQVIDYVKDSEFKKIPFESPHLSASSGNSQGMVNGQKPVELCGHSPDGRQPSPLTSPLLNDAGSVRTDDEDEVRRKVCGPERAPVKGLELERDCCQLLCGCRCGFKSPVSITNEAAPDSLKSIIFSNFDPLYKFHSGFLREVEQRLALWEGRSNAHIKGDYQRIGDVMLKNLQGLKPLTAHLQKHSEALVELEKACRGSRRLEVLVRDFELQKVCYIPLNVFILRPLHRLLHYKQILERLCKHYPPTHVDFRDCRAALADVSEVVAQLHGSMIKMENFQKLLELKKDLIGIDSLVTPERVSSSRDLDASLKAPYSLYSAKEFIRLGCLSKLSGKGLQQRMFFLFNDVLLYTSRGMTATNQFKVHGQLPLHDMTIRESEDEWGVPHAFTLVGQRQSVVVAASSLSEMEKWMEDIKMAIDLAETSNGHTADLLARSLTDNKSTTEDSCAETESEDDLMASRTSLERQAPHRGNTTVHVCWHRNTSVSMVDFSIAVENQLSGNLLRKFKNSNGWQKLWVVFTNFSLFFYKTHQDDYPLASLPLLGYSVTIPTESENIHKDYVFKLHFKSHVYYFRSESEYTFERWMEVIRSATVSASSTRILSRKEPHPY